MALNKETFKTAIKQSATKHFTKMITNLQKAKSPTDLVNDFENFAEDLANIIDNYLKSATVTGSLNTATYQILGKLL